MKLLIQIPCLNESETLPLVFQGLPRHIEGISEIETLIIDDGSTDETSTVAKQLGATHIIRNTTTLGLAHTFRRGLDYCLSCGADIIINMDGDNQYPGTEIEKLLVPILEKRADIVIGDRQTNQIAEFSAFKKLLQREGSRVVRILSKTAIRDVTSGFRAFTRDAAIKLTVLSNYTYTLESILQAPSKGLAITDVTITTNPKTRESRLMSSIRSYLAFSVATIIRIFTMYNPFRVFFSLGSICLGIGMIVGLRFVYYYITTGGHGKVQSLILAAIALVTGAMILLVGMIADLIQFNRRLSEDILERVKRLELQDR